MVLAEIKVLEMVKRKDDPVVLTYLGYSHRKLGDVDLGITLYKQALDVDLENVDTSDYPRRRICDRGTTRSGTA